MPIIGQTIINTRSSLQDKKTSAAILLVLLTQITPNSREEKQYVNHGWFAQSDARNLCSDVVKGDTKHFKFSMESLTNLELLIYKIRGLHTP